MGRLIEANDADTLSTDLGVEISKCDSTSTVRSLGFTRLSESSAIEKSSESDITIYGATSFVAKHVITYLVQTSIHTLQPLKITLAGRNLGKIESLKEEWSKKMELLETATPATGKGRCNFDVHIADGNNIDGIRRMTARANVVLNCAGPFAHYSSNVVGACAEFGTDYVDITGEIGWVGEMRAKHGPVAAKSGARIISFCGYDSVPSDLAVFAAIEALKKESRRGVVEIEKASTWHTTTGGLNGGTINTMRSYPIKFGFGGGYVPFLVEDPLVLTHPDVRRGANSIALRNKFAKAEWLNQLLMFHTFLKGGMSMPYIMALTNAKVVHASSVSLKYGPNFTYQERFLPVGFKGTMHLQGLSVIPAVLSHLAILLGLLILKLPIVGALLIQFMGYQSGTGPSDAACSGGHAEIYAEVCGPVDPLDGNNVDKANCYMKFNGDPCNWITAQCVAEAALALLLNSSDLPNRSTDGFGTPAELLGHVLLKRLRKSPVRRIEFATDVRKRTNQTEWKMFP